MSTNRWPGDYYDTPVTSGGGGSWDPRPPGVPRDGIAGWWWSLFPDYTWTDDGSRLPAAERDAQQRYLDNLPDSLPSLPALPGKAGINPLWLIGGVALLLLLLLRRR